MSHLADDISSDDDEDYVPSEESDDYEESPRLVGKRKCAAETSKTTSRKRKGGIKLDEENSDDEQESENESDVNSSNEAQVLSEKERKVTLEQADRINKLWQDVKCDTDRNDKNRTTANAVHDLVVTKSVEDPVMKKGLISNRYVFAGEEAKISENSLNFGRDMLSKNAPINKKPALGSILGQIGKKQKLSTLEKSKLDWNDFKSKEGIEDELTYHNKDGYLERQSFLNNVNEKQFEIERSLRLGSKRK